MRNDLIPEGATLLAVSLLSRGPMTAPRALVAYKRGHGPTDYVTHEVNLGGFPASLADGHYNMTLSEALADFKERLERDVERYLEHEIPLTEPDWLNVRSWIEVVEAREEWRVMTPGVSFEELLERHKKATGIHPPKGWDEVPGGAEELAQLRSDEASEAMMHERPEDLTDRPSASDLDMGRAIR